MRDGRTSIILEGQKSISNGSEKTTQVINKATMIKTSPPISPSSKNSSHLLPPITFLDQCFLCKQRLLPGKDIYMYKGDRAFCSVECRCRQIFMDEEESVKRDQGNCSLAAIKVKTSSSSSSSSSSSRHHRKGGRNKDGGFAY
ncbi:Zf-FLZ domain [Dillenia turbinata]|uniref:Zf-FLZ domain n=1 Tax=Dillenia turbinata TaxID=194707 RepID=A0AAN8UM58_9MAGN